MSQTKVFNAGSPGFLYALITLALTIFAISGVQLPASPGDIAGDIQHGFSTGGYWALIGILTSSVVFPIWNAWQKGNLSFGGIFKNQLTWKALAVALFAGLALVGLDFPEGTAEQLVSIIYAKDWAALISMAVTVIWPTLSRLFKSRK